MLTAIVCRLYGIRYWPHAYLHATNAASTIFFVSGASGVIRGGLAKSDRE